MQNIASLSLRCLTYPAQQSDVYTAIRIRETARYLWIRKISGVKNVSKLKEWYFVQCISGLVSFILNKAGEKMKSKVKGSPKSLFENCFKVPQPWSIDRKMPLEVPIVYSNTVWDGTRSKSRVMSWDGEGEVESGRWDFQDWVLQLLAPEVFLSDLPGRHRDCIDVWHMHLRAALCEETMRQFR